MRKSVLLRAVAAATGILLLPLIYLEKKEQNVFDIQSMQPIHVSLKQKMDGQEEPQSQIEVAQKETYPDTPASPDEYLNVIVSVEEHQNEVLGEEKTEMTETNNVDKSENGIESENRNESENINESEIIEDSEMEKDPDYVKESEEQSPADEPETIRGFVIDNDGMLSHYYGGDGSVNDGCLELLLEDCSGIRANAFESCRDMISEIYIPNEITNIEEGAFRGLNNLEWLDLDEDNTNYCSVDGILFNVDKTRLIVFPSGRSGNYSMDAAVMSIGYGAFFDTHLSRIDFMGSNPLSFTGQIFDVNPVNDLTIRVREEMQPYYEEKLSGYHITIEGIGYD